tara:strand:- start:954 stop:1712 length:759 start_codon:yes stop_codon:yes gene_type:complete
MIWLILPCYNEKQNLVKIINKIKILISKKKYKIKVIIIDDGSIDGTELLFSKYKKRNKINKNLFIYYKKHEQNQGLHKALDTGFRYIISKSKKNDIIVSLDADNTHPIGSLPRLISNIKNGYNVVIASRYVRGAKVIGLPKYRLFLSYCAALVFKVFFRINVVKDFTCNFRGYEASLIKKCYKKYKQFISERGFACVPDILLKIHMLDTNIKFSEVPLILKYDLKIGRSKMKIFTTIIKTLKIVIKRKIGIL